jgi:subtilisin family serine protease
MPVRSNACSAALSATIAAAAILVYFPPAAAQAETAIIHPNVKAALDASDEVDVIVSFRDPQPHSVVQNMETHRLAIQQIREAVLAKAPTGFAVRRQFAHVPAVAGRMSRVALDALSRDPNVWFIQIDSRGGGALTVSVPAIGADMARSNYHVTGKGVRVAVLDTGANSSHPDLKSSILSTQHCFTHGACPPSDTSEGTSAEDDHGHGSHVAGIITSDGVVAGAGFAPDAEIVPVKVDDRNDMGLESDWTAGLDWVFSNLGTLKVKLINMSICTNNLYASASDCDAAEPALAKAVKNLVDAGVTIFAASGNRGDSGKLSAPACNTGVIAVGATYKSAQGRQPTSGTYSQTWGSSFANCSDATTAFDQVACFTNSGPRLDMVAPGAVIVSDVLGTKTEQYRGTSQASPTAVGVAALMLECNPGLTPAQIKDTLIRTAVAVPDAKNGLSFPSIRADEAVKAACGSGGPDGGVASTGGSSGKNGGIGGTGGSSGKDGGIGGTGGSSGKDGGISGTGGSSGKDGGISGTGGSSGLGGLPWGLGGNGTGGDSSAGGAVAAGGSFATGGILAKGGSSGSGPASGGAVASGGSRAGGASSSSGCGCEVGKRSEAGGSPATLVPLALLLGLVLRLSRRRRSGVPVAPDHGFRDGRVRPAGSPEVIH